MNNNIIKKIKFLVSIAIVVLFVWFLVIYPMITFHNNEKELENAAKRYYELNSNQLPIGERVKTLSLSVLYKGAYLKHDFKVPYTNKMCSVEKSWVKIKKVDGEYKYYVFLDCGILKSSIDHKGPDIKLNGSNKMTINVGSKYEEPGISSVVDDNEGKMKTEDVTIKSNVDTSKIGTYQVTYTAYDSLLNKNVVTREVRVVKTIKGVVKKDLGSASNYVGSPDNNYVRLSNMLFRIYGLKNNNVVLVSNEDVSNVNHTKIEKWLDEVYYKHLTNESKKMIVKSKFCNMNIDESSLNTTECNSYTTSRYVYIPSIVEVNKADSNENNFMKPLTMSWLANKKDEKNAYLTRNIFFGDDFGKSYLAYSATDNYGVRPMFLIKGNSLITDGNGTIDDPYVFNETPKAKKGELLNTRYSGEYFEIGNEIWRIIEISSDKATKAISVGTIFDSNGNRINTDSMSNSNSLIYNPNKKNNVGYFINNRISKSVDSAGFINHTIEVPIYKKKIIYGNENSMKKYNVKFSAPNMYDMFSAMSKENHGSLSYSYWLTNSVEGTRYEAALTDIGVPINGEIGNYSQYGIRLVGYVNSNKVISSGKGTYMNPYVLK